jgi:hypothetical protein
MARSIYRWQAALVSGDTHRYCWVDEPVKVGNLITLKDSDEPERQWEVTWVGGRWHHSHINTDGWKVGGLGG